MILTERKAWRKKIPASMPGLDGHQTAVLPVVFVGRRQSHTIVVNRFTLVFRDK